MHIYPFWNSLSPKKWLLKFHLYSVLIAQMRVLILIKFVMWARTAIFFTIFSINQNLKAVPVRKNAKLQFSKNRVLIKCCWSTTQTKFIDPSLKKCQFMSWRWKNWDCYKIIISQNHPFCSNFQVKTITVQYWQKLKWTMTAIIKNSI